MPKSVLSDAEAKLLMKKLNRRMSALSVLTRGPQAIQWSVGLLQFFLWGLIGAWMYWGGGSDSRMGYLLFPVTMTLLGIMEVYNANLNKRIDALVELLQQEGMLHSGLRPDSAKEP